MTTTTNGCCLKRVGLLWLFLLSLVSSQSPPSHLRGSRQLQSRQYSLWSPIHIHSTLLQWKNQYPNLVKLTTAQDAYGLSTAGNASDCPYDDGDGCKNYILTIQDFLVHPENSPSSNALPEVLWSGEVHGDERVGPTAVMEAASLLLQAASCEATFEYNPTLHASCSSTLQQQYGIHKRRRLWLARLVSTRRIVIVPTANALGYYQNTRREDDIDVNRDFPFDYNTTTQASLCMRTIAGRTLNELFRSHLFQLSLTFHGGMELIGYEWGANSYRGVLSPDDTAQSQIANAYSTFGGGWNTSSNYPVGPMDQLVYTIQGGMEDWAYAGSWIRDKVVQCQPSTHGGYAAYKTVYNDSMLRAFNILIEASSPKTPSFDTLGTSDDVLSSSTAGNGHVSRNIRLSLLSADLVEPYLSFVGVDSVALATDILPLTGRNCARVNAVRVPQTRSQVTVEWTVGGALEIDETELYYGSWSDVVTQVDCLTQPSNTLDSTLMAASMISPTNGTGYFSNAGASPPTTTSTSATGDLPLGPVFRASVNLSSFGLGDEVFVIAKARVDQSWLDQPGGIAPLVPPQAHIVNARTNPTWFHQNNGRVIQGRLDWYSVIPLTLVISDTTEVEDFAAVFEQDAVLKTAAPSRTPTMSPTPVPTPKPTESLTPVPTPMLTVDSGTKSDGADGLYADARCNAHSMCLFYGLADNCCPTNQGIYLDCCGY